MKRWARGALRKEVMRLPLAVEASASTSQAQDRGSLFFYSQPEKKRPSSMGGVFSGFQPSVSPRPAIGKPSRATVVTDTSVGGRQRSCFKMGSGPAVPFEMHARHRQKLLDRLQTALGSEAKNCAVVLQGGAELSVYDTDTTWEFKQESNFQWLFGVKEPGCHAALDLTSGESLLFVPKLPVEYEAWMGERRSLEWFKDTYEVDGAAYVDDMAEQLSKRGIKKLIIYRGVNRDSGLCLPLPKFPGVDKFELRQDSLLSDHIAECRVIKDEEEIKILQFANDVSSDAHVAVMQGARAGASEFEAEALFKYSSYLRGCARVGYSCICPSGPRCAVLHYGHAAFPNAEEVQQGEMKLHDMGAEYHCYTSDVTCSFPVDGRFTPEQKVVYEAVWEANQAVTRNIAPGVTYVDMHQLSERVMLEEMVKAGLFKGDVSEMHKAKVMDYFMPHGLGHCLGLDVHDVGGYKVGESRHDYPQVRQNLRCGRELMEGMVITVEPGFYFGDYLVTRALQDPVVSTYIVPERLAELRPVGGVRIEDNVVVTADGCLVLTRVPRTVKEIEAVMSGSPWSAEDQKHREYRGGAEARGKTASK